MEACLEAASSPLIGLMDADDRGDPERFARLLEALKKNPDWDGACSAVRIFGSVSEARGHKLFFKDATCIIL